MKITYSYCIFLVLSFLVQKNFGQSNFLHSVNASGKNISSDTGTISYSIGQVFFSHSKNESHYIDEGAQQVYHKTITDNEDIDSSNEIINILVFPNPTSDIVILEAKGLDFNNNINSYQLFNYQGKLIKKQNLKQQSTQINLTYLSASFYILQIFVEEKLWKTVKIIKD